MYNLYTYEKRKREIESENTKNPIKTKEYIKKRDKLANKFYSKINNFLFEMAKKPIIIKNNYYIENEKIETTNIRPKFETERERIAKLIKSQQQYHYKANLFNSKRKRLLKKNIIINDAINKNNEISNISNNNNFNKSTEIIYHPSDQSNHTPNDLEKILDTIYINQESNNQNNDPDKSDEQKVKKIINKRMVIKENKKMKPPKIQLKRDQSNPNIKGIYDYNNMTNIEQRLFFLRKEKKKNNNKKSKLKLNNTARNTQKNANNIDNYKTYFNSIQQAIICKAKENNIKNKSKGVINNYKGLRGSSSAINFFSPKKKIINPFNDTDNNLEKTKNLFTKRTNREDFCINNNEIVNQNSTFLENRKKIIEKILQLNNPPNYDKQLKNVRINALKILKEMAMRDDDKHKKIFNMKEPEEQANFSGFYSNYEISDISGVHSKINNIKNKINKKEIIEDENLILYNNCVYYKNDQKDLNKLGKIILQKCHFVNNKFNDDENNKLKKGNGKLMITNGLSINEFIDKFSLPNLIH